MQGRTLGLILVGSAAVLGALMYWLQVYAFYRPVSAEDAAMTIETEEGPQPLDTVAFDAITADSSPIRFRACFEIVDPAALQALARPAPDAVPLNAPGWFDCFDAAELGDDLAEGRATAILSAENRTYGIDRIVAISSDGRGHEVALGF